MGKKIIYKTIAAEAGVSVMSVSNVLRNPASVRAETRERVHAAILALGGELPDTKPDTKLPGNRPIITHRPHRRFQLLTSGVAQAQRETPVFSRLFQELISQAAASDFDVNLVNLEVGDPLDPDRVFQRTDVLFLMGNWAHLHVAPPVPVITLMRTEVPFPHCHVGYNRSGVGRVAAEHLIDKGFRHVAYVGPPTEKRHKEFTSVFTKGGGVCDTYLVPGPYKLEHGQQRIDLGVIKQAVASMIKTTMPEAIFTHADQISVALKGALSTQLGKRKLPYIIGCNFDPPYMELMGAGAASVELGISEMARLAVARAVEMAKHPSGYKQTILVEPYVRIMH